MKCNYLYLIFDDKVYLFQTNAVIWVMTILPNRCLVALCSVLWPAWEGGDGFLNRVAGRFHGASSRSPSNNAAGEVTVVGWTLA